MCSWWLAAIRTITSFWSLTNEGKLSLQVLRMPSVRWRVPSILELLNLGSCQSLQPQLIPFFMDCGHKRSSEWKQAKLLILSFSELTRGPTIQKKRILHWVELKARPSCRTGSSCSCGSNLAAWYRKLFIQERWGQLQRNGWSRFVWSDCSLSCGRRGINREPNFISCSCQALCQVHPSLPNSNFFYFIFKFINQALEVVANSAQTLYGWEA